MSFNEISSLSEKKINLLIGSNKSDLIKHNQTCLTRIYPIGTRVNSSNYSPIECWSAGCQLVALNFQTIGYLFLYLVWFDLRVDRGIQINNALFAMNACSGYVLKPVIHAKPITLSITVSSIQIYDHNFMLKHTIQIYMIITLWWHTLFKSIRSYLFDDKHTY